MLRGHVGMRDTWQPADEWWHLVDVDTRAWPLATRCGQQVDPMNRQVRPLRAVTVDEACPDCLVAAAAGGTVDLRQLRGA